MYHWRMERQKAVDSCLIILAAVAKYPKDAEQKFCMSRRRRKAYCRMVTTTTQTDKIYVSITGYFVIAASIMCIHEVWNFLCKQVLRKENEK